MKIAKGKFEDDLLDTFDEITGQFAPLCISRVKDGKGMKYVDRRSNETIAYWRDGRGEVFNFTKDGQVLPRFKFNLKNRKSLLTPTAIWAMIERQAQTTEKEK